MQDWKNLKCDCGSEQFIQMITLRIHPTGGSTQGPGGEKCGLCGKVVNRMDLLNKAKLEQKKAELKALQEEVGVTPKPVTSSPS